MLQVNKKVGYYCTDSQTVRVSQSEEQEIEGKISIYGDSWTVAQIYELGAGQVT